ncbi:MAG: hypothetical protein BZ138_00460 [Methanosphaera sp. rholeuAM270]|nr:MAG: hypothetical protein BZ138_00460 [Methanosphaera sp. rholeuAM270]
MDTARFETFIDAILAIMMTVMVLKIPQPETLSITGIWDLKIMYLGYIISFIVLFSIWDHHRKFFDKVEYINNTVVWMYSILMFFTTLIPFFTSWVAHHPYDLIPELMFGLTFFIVNLLFVSSSILTVRTDTHNHQLQEINFEKIFLINTTLYITGAILTLLSYPLAMMIVCLFTIVTWNILTHLEERYKAGEQ